MSNDSPLINPLISAVDDADVEWASALLGLDRIDGPRREFLTSLDTLDVSACPGSGKTSLVVAKLAILGRKWPSSTQGICVLSHTNVAREEIQRKIAGTSAGQRLLHYPHYIGTIHGFVNRFLAIPWLLSHGHSITAIDDDIASDVLKRNLGQVYYQLIQPFLDHRHYDFERIRVSSIDFDNPLSGSDFPAGPASRSYQAANIALQKRATQGFFCHDEMFLFGETLLAEYPQIAAILRRRFPFVLVDEMQDTSARQSRLLDLIFDHQSETLRIQRAGDPNQAIFDDGEPREASVFPDPRRKSLTLADSFRFDNSIATLASGLALTPIAPGGLVGIRAKQDDEPEMSHTIFVFPDDDTSQVLSAYGSHVCNVFGDFALEQEGAAVTAVGEVHRAKDDVRPGDAKYPGTVSHYWDGYRASIGRRSAMPATLIECIRKSRSMVVAGDRVSDAADVTALGIISLVNQSSGRPLIRPGLRPHRSLEWALAEYADFRRLYRNFLVRFVLRDGDLSQQAWNGGLRADVRAAVISFIDPGASIPDDLLAWKPLPGSGFGDSVSAAPLNIFRVQAQDCRVDIQLSSIHAVKGQTHLSTLVLETFNRQHVFKTLMPWLTGRKTGAQSSTSDLVQKRLRMAYVAMTRPSHLLCLALPRSSLGPQGEATANLASLTTMGWKVVELRAGDGDAPRASCA